MSPLRNKKICLICMKLSGGGVPRSTATISRILENLGHEVHIVTILNGVDYNYSGKLFNLEEKREFHSALFRKVFKWRMLKKYFKKENFDLIIDNRTRIQFFKELTFQKMLFRDSKVLSVVHSGNIKNYLPVNRQYFKFLYNKNYLLGVSQHIQNKIQELYGVKSLYVYNAIDVQENTQLSTNHISVDFKYILFSGRIDEGVKNLHLLISSYEASVLSVNNIHLIIMGDGPDKESLIHFVRQRKLEESIHFITYDPNPFPFMKKALFTVLTSRYEGFPMILLESLSVGTPTISVDGISGPSEIIQDGFNGLLVENHNPLKLAEAFNKLVRDESLYLKCKSNAKQSVQRFDISEITKDWAYVLKQIFNDND
ncbi:glycosyltransferase [Aegicerativicinus sediminis]|uniref:glycosyltransferase n=1 Tax=Aegicerativicinus sediminis TaxID=2893202 RepID=UPI001E304CE0|nr:glycosyltransferase [Aegicerativicinus sediminis]